MPTAYYANYHDGHSGRRDRYGGQPAYLPRGIPRCPSCGNDMAFVLQLYCHPNRLPVPGALCLHFYQCLNDDDNELVLLPEEASENVAQNVMVHPETPIREIEWTERVDPEPDDYDVEKLDALEADPAQQYLYEDKLGGFFPWVDEGGTPAKDLGCIGQIRWLDDMTCYLFLGSDGQPTHELF